jgi:hypothetical protein
MCWSRGKPLNAQSGGLRALGFPTGAMLTGRRRGLVSGTHDHHSIAVGCVERNRASVAKAGGSSPAALCVEPENAKRAQ